MDERLPVLQLFAADTQVVEQLAIGEIDLSGWSHRVHQRWDVVENEAQVALDGGRGRPISWSIHRVRPLGRRTRQDCGHGGSRFASRDVGDHPTFRHGCNLKDPSEVVLRQCDVSISTPAQRPPSRIPRNFSASKSPRASLARAVLPSIVVRSKGDGGDELVHDEGRHADLLQGLGHGPARRLQPWMALEFRCVGGPDVVPRVAWLPLRRARSPRTRPVEPAVDRQRHGHLRGRPGRARPGARSEKRDSRRALHGRRRGGAVYRPPRYGAGREGRPGRRDHAADAADAGQSRRVCRCRCSTTSAPVS